MYLTIAEEQEAQAAGLTLAEAQTARGLGIPFSEYGARRPVAEDPIDALEFKARGLEELAKGDPAVRQKLLAMAEAARAEAATLRAARQKHA